MNVSALVLMVVLGAAAGLAWRSRVRGYGLGFGVCALLPGWAFASSLSWPFAVLVAAGAAGLVWQRWSSSQARVGRWSARARRSSGLASPWAITRHGGVWPVRRLAAKVRPRLTRELGLVWRWLLLPTAEVGMELSRVGVQRLWASLEQVVVIVGGPRMGKTGWLAARINDAPGMVVVTSTRTDVIELCGPVRAATRGPVYVFNAAGLGGVGSDIVFDPLSGCGDPDVASERAEDLVRGGAKSAAGERAHWEDMAAEVLAAFLHAAALGGRSMHDVHTWTADVAACSREVPALLETSDVAGFATSVTQFVTTNDRTRTSITSSMKPALRWLMRPSAVAAAGHDSRNHQAGRARPVPSFDVERLLAERATVFLLGTEDRTTTPLMMALTGYIARTARRIAADATHPLSCGGRLDPPLTLALDECALIAPIPLERWTADMGGRGVAIIAAFQSRAQVVSRYGVHDAAAIFDNCGATVLFGGTADLEDLRWWAQRAGERDEVTATTDPRGHAISRSVRRVPVFTVDQVANLRPGQVIVYRTGIAASIGWARMAWRRRDVRAIAAGWHAHTATPGVLGAIRYAAHRPTARALLGLDRALAGLVTRVARAAATVLGPVTRPLAAVAVPLGRRVRAVGKAWVQVVLERLRFTARRARRARRARAPRDVAVPAVVLPPAPLHVVSYREPQPGPAAQGLADDVAAGLVEVDPPTGPIDLTSYTTARAEHATDAHTTATAEVEMDPPTGPIDLSRLHREHGSDHSNDNGAEDGQRPGRQPGRRSA